MTTKLKICLLASVLILGYTSLSFELIVLRQLVSFVGANTLVTSIIMAFVLLFLSLGYYLGSVCHFSHIVFRKYMRCIIGGLAMWYIIACSYYFVSLFFALLYWKFTLSALMLTTLYSAVFLALPSIGLGFITAGIGRIMHRFDSDYTGRFMAIDTVGSVLGSLLTTLVFMPLIGVEATISVLVLLTLSVSLLTARKNKRVLVWLQFGLMACLLWVLNLPQITDPEHVLIKNDAISRIEIVPVAGEGDFDSKIMQINGQLASKFSTDDEKFFYYIQYINNTFINNLPQSGEPAKILVLGAGGFTVGIHDEYNLYTYVDIDKDLQKISEQRFLPEPLSDNKKFVAQDAYFYMLSNKEKYDLIVVDIFSDLTNIPINFVTVDFFRMVKAHLADNGFMIANIFTSPLFDTPFAQRIDNTLRHVFEHSLSRQIIQNYNPYQQSDNVNVLYIYRNHPAKSDIYTLDKNTAVYR